METIRLLFQKLTNSFDTIGWGITGVLALMTTYLHCEVPAGDATIPVGTCNVPDWIGSISPHAVIISGIVFGFLTGIGKLLRPGGFLRSFFGSTAVVVPTDSKHSVAGTATPEHVASA